MGLWYAMNNEQAEVPPPLFWKQVLVTIFTVYPLILLADLLLNLLFPMRLLPPQLAIFFTVILMVKPVMPWVTRILGDWLHKR